MTSKICTASAVRNGPSYIHFRAQRRPHRGKLLCRKLGRQLSPEEALETPEGVKIFAEWGPTTKLFGRNRNRGYKRKIRLGEIMQRRSLLLLKMCTILVL